MKFFSLTATLLLAAGGLFGQTPGLIFVPQGGMGVTPLNPNGDGWSSISNTGYVSNDVLESDVVYTPLPVPYAEPTSDLVRGADCRFSDIVRIDVYDSGVYMATDGTNLMFRFRQGGTVPGSKGYSILIDTDGRFGNSGPNADPNFIPKTTGINGNPGFEIEIVLETNFRVAMYNVDGIDNPSVPAVSYPYNTHHQRSVALTNNCDDPDYFHDFYIVLSDLYSAFGINANTPLRFAATTVMAPKPAIGGPLSDINGGGTYEEVVFYQCGTSIAGLTNGICSCTNPPTINGPIPSGTNVPVTGNWSPTSGTKPNNATISVYVNGDFVGSTPTTGGEGWSVTVPGPLVNGDTIYATAQAPGESVCDPNPQIIIVSDCHSGNTPAAPFIECVGAKGIRGTAQPNAIIRIYRYLAPPASPTQNLVATITASAAGVWGWDGLVNVNNTTANICTAGSGDMQEGTYHVTQTNGVPCTSASSSVCLDRPGGGFPLSGSSAAPVITTNPIASGVGTIAGTAVTGQIIRLYVNGVFRSSVIAAANAFSFMGVSPLNAGDQVRVTAQANLQCESAAATATVACNVMAPTINANDAQQVAAGQPLTGTSSYIGATIRIFNAAAPTVPVATTTVLPGGTWTSAPFNAVAGVTYFATVLTACGSSSASLSVSALAATTGRCGAFTNTPYNENSTSVTGTLTGSVANTTVNLYLDGFLIGTTTTNNTLWAIPVNTTLNNILYGGGVLSIGVQQPGQMEQRCPATTTINCNAPPMPIVTPGFLVIANPQSTATFNISNTVAGVLYAIEDAASPYIDRAVSVFSTGTSFSITTFPFTDAGVYNLRVKAMTFSGFGCESFGTMAVEVPDAGPDGIPNPIDLDDDDDGIPDVVEVCGIGAVDFSCMPGGADPCIDSDGDGIVNYQDPNYCVLNAAGVCASLDKDGDGIIDQFDLDSDNDGIPDIVEAGGVDTNGDGIIDMMSDQDNDGLIDKYDPDCTGGMVVGRAGSAGQTTATVTNAGNAADGNAASFAVVSMGGSITLTLQNPLPAGTTLALTLSGNAAGDATGIITSSSAGGGFAHAQPYAMNGTTPTVVHYIITEPNTQYIRITRQTGATRVYEANYNYMRCSGGTALVPNDADGDGIPNFKDLDSDNDGIPDVIEVGGTDANGDGMADNYVDLDGDGFNDRLDGDAGNDGIAENSANALVRTGEDTDNDGAPNSYATADFDGDRIPNFLDLDADNDGIADVVEAGGVDANGDGRLDNYNDADGDGFDDTVDGDVGNDGIAENSANALVLTGPDGNNDGNPDNYTVGDFDGDGLLNFLDLDADNDGIQDVLEAGGTDANGDGMVDGYTDTDGDGWSQNVDGDQNNDGVIDNLAGVLIVTGPDANNDGNPDNYPFADDIDRDKHPNFLDLDSDNDGITDVVENAAGNTSGPQTTDNPNGAGSLDGYVGQGSITDMNGNGWHDPSQGTPTMLDSDGDGIPNIYDIDSDNDGIADFVEGTCSTCPQFNPSNLPGGTDLNGNGVLDIFENLTNANGNGGTNVGLNPNEDDNDGIDGVADFLDHDTDNDGYPDWAEGFDSGFGGAAAGNGNAAQEVINMANLFVINYENFYGPAPANMFPNIDMDGDGLPVWLDTDDNVHDYTLNQQPPFLNPNSPYWFDLDNDGLADIFDFFNNIDGFVLGTFAPVPDNDAVNDRDWRDNNTAVDFPIELLYFQAQKQGKQALLAWATETERDNDYFLVQRSPNGVSGFETIGTVQGAGTTLDPQYYTLVDAQPLNGMNYYRLQQVDFDGTFTYSEIRALEFAAETVVVIAPNPTDGIIRVEIRTPIQDGSRVELIDELGRRLQTFNLSAAPATTLDLDLSDLPAAAYIVRVLNNESLILIEKVIKK